MADRTFRIAVFPGDGIGGEITRPCTELLQAAADKVDGFGLDFEWLPA
ncbi:MAG: isocitrate/isopropylmalate dehydrogenase family protein, partial [Proteobacteria bacterium]|nr:isocitrate/isopropylmalate dehydrogenase family protein [Pseudomonadota bacterium]